MNTQPIETVTERISLFISDKYAEPRWVEIDTTGAAPETVNGFERATGTDAAVPIYRSPALTRPRYAMLEELVKISSGIAPAEGAHREQMRALRERVESAEAEIEERAQELSAGAVNRAMDRADDAHQRYEAAKRRAVSLETGARGNGREVLELNHRIGKIIEEARRWKRHALAADAEADTLHAAITSAEMRARVAERDRDAIERKLDDTLNVLRQNREILATERAERLDAEARISDAQAKALSTIEKIANLIPAPESAELPPFEISTYYGTDNTPVVEIDTQLIEGRLRINLNDAPIWDGDPETDERPGANLLETDVREIRGATIIGATVTQDSNGRGFISVEAEIDDVREVELPAVGESAFPAPRQNMKTTISRQIEAIRDRDARIEELEEERTEARNELSATRRELDSTAESLRLSEQHFENAVTLSEQRQERVEELLAERDELQAERDALATDRDAADHMRKRLDERLADVTRAGAITAAGLRSMIRQRDELLRSASRLFTSHLGAPFSSDDLDEGLRIANAHGNLAKLDDEPTSRADESVLDLVRVAGKVVRFWRAAPTSVVTEQLNIALAELANLTKR